MSEGRYTSSMACARITSRREQAPRPEAGRSAPAFRRVRWRRRDHLGVQYRSLGRALSRAGPGSPGLRPHRQGARLQRPVRPPRHPHPPLPGGDGRGRGHVMGSSMSGGMCLAVAARKRPTGPSPSSSAAPAAAKRRGTRPARSSTPTTAAASTCAASSRRCLSTRGGQRTRPTSSAAGGCRCCRAPGRRPRPRASRRPSASRLAAQAARRARQHRLCAHQGADARLRRPSRSAAQAGLHRRLRAADPTRRAARARDARATWATSNARMSSTRAY